VTSYKILASEPCWVDFSIQQANRSVEEGIPHKQGLVHDMNGFYAVVTLWDEEEICSLRDRDMAEALLLELQDGRISEDEARRITDSGFRSFLYSIRVNFRSLLGLVE